MSNVLVVCARRYNGHELWVALGVLALRGHSFEVISTDTIIQDEITMQPNKIERTIYDVTQDSANDFDALMIVSGNMDDTEAYWKERRVLDYVDTFNAVGKPIAAICCSVPTVRNAAKDKKVSFFPLLRSRALLREAGAILQTVALSRDQNLVTAEHQMASEMWANEFCNVLEGKPQEYHLVDSGFVPRGRERKPIKQLVRLQKRSGGQTES